MPQAITNEDRRQGDWMQTFTGKMFYPIDPRPEDIDIEDIAHALAHLCRFAGHCINFYSVAEHSVRVAREVEARLYGYDPKVSYGADVYTKATVALQALLHDATEAYLIDVPRPLKRAPGMEAYRTYEKNLERMIMTRFGLPPELLPIVHDVDGALLLTEGRDLLGPHPAPWGFAQGRTDIEPLPNRIPHPLAPKEAKRQFLALFRIYSDALQGELR
jgi:hypothetical protein